MERVVFSLFVTVMWAGYGLMLVGVPMPFYGPILAAFIASSLLGLIATAVGGRKVWQS